MLDEFRGDETLLTSHETPSFDFLSLPAKLMVFNVMKPSMKLPLKLALLVLQPFTSWTNKATKKLKVEKLPREFV